MRADKATDKDLNDDSNGDNDKANTVLNEEDLTTNDGSEEMPSEENVEYIEEKDEDLTPATEGMEDNQTGSDVLRGEEKGTEKGQTDIEEKNDEDDSMTTEEDFFKDEDIFDSTEGRWSSF